jgi:hypothetical protein
MSLKAVAFTGRDMSLKAVAFAGRDMSLKASPLPVATCL